MKATHYTYCTPFGDELATVTGKSAARGRDSVHNLRFILVKAQERVGALRTSCVTLRVRKQRAEAEVARLRAELAAEQAKSAEWRDTAERCFAAAMKNAVALADERKGKRGE